MQKENIVMKFKYGKNKAAIIEHYLFLIKKALYMLLRGTLSKDWVSALPNIITKLNNSPLKRLGNLKPNDINGIQDSYRVLELKEKLGRPIFKEPSFDEQQRNQELYYSNEKNVLREESYCYVDFKTSVFDKAYDVSVFSDFLSKICSLFLLLALQGS